VRKVLGLAIIGMAFAMASLPLAAQTAPALDEGQVREDPVPTELAAEASAAVAKLGSEIVLGKYQMAVDRMYPGWKAKVAARAGGIDALRRQLEAVPAKLVKDGVSVLSCEPQGTPRVLQVGLAAQGTGNQARFTKWLVIVPTATRARIMHADGQGPPQALVIESTGYQVAVADKGSKDWTFIDGAGLTLAELRALFPTLPSNLPLPEVTRRRIR
jgi:hypothetical protein